MKKKLIIFAIIALILYVGTASFSLIKTGERSTVSYPLSKELKERIVNETHELDEIDILNYGLELTDELLEFDETNNIKEGKANCVGYALLCANIMNYGLKVNNLEGTCKPVVGYVEWGGLNLCTILKAIAPKKYKAFVNDHDFVEYDLVNSTIFFDPTLYDLLGERAMCSEDKQDR
jgi:hypothetical protein